MKTVDLANPHVNLIGTAQLAEVIGVHKTTLSRWTTENRRGIRSCQFSRGVFVISELRAKGILAPSQGATP